MAAALNTTGEIVTADQTYDLAQIMVRGQTATIRQRGVPGVVVSRDDVAAVTSVNGAPRQRQYLISFVNGDQWSVTMKARPCGCGR
jgi:hypothetical protein